MVRDAPMPPVKGKTTTTKPLEKRGGYGAGDKLVSELKPPPAGPAPSSRRPAQNDAQKK